MQAQPRAHHAQSILLQQLLHHRPLKGEQQARRCLPHCVRLKLRDRLSGGSSGSGGGGALSARLPA